MYADDTLLGKICRGTIMDVSTFMGNFKRIFEADHLKVNITKTDILYFSSRSLGEQFVPDIT